MERSVGPAQAGPWNDLLQQLRTAIAPALIRPEASSALQEDYLIGVVHRFDQDMSAALLQARVDLVPLLSGERRMLSEGRGRTCCGNDSPITPTIWWCSPGTVLSSTSRAAIPT